VLYFSGSSSNATTSSTAPATTEKIPVNVVLILADDLGWNDLGSFHGNPQDTFTPLTPHMDALMRTGVKLKTFHVFPVCSPTRAALLTGRYPIRFGGQSFVGNAASKTWLPSTETTIADRMKALGLRTRMVGKWHLGHSEDQYTPTGRGFETFMGSYLGAGDHFLHTLGRAEDLMDDQKLSCIYRHSQKIWPIDSLDLRRENGALAGEQRRQFVFSKEGVHSSDVIGQEAVDLIHQHDVTEGMFLYLPFQAPHTPTQSVESDTQANEHIPSLKRRTFAGMVTGMDRNVGHVVQALKERGMYDNTVIWFLADNGAELAQGGSNYPLRGGKASGFQGGVMVPSFVSGGLVPPEVQGQTYDGILSVVDIAPTLEGLVRARMPPSVTPPTANSAYPPQDGFNVWSVIMQGGTSPRASTPTLLALDPIDRVHCAKASGNSLGCDVKAVRVGKYKLVTGSAGRGDWFGADSSDGYPGECHYCESDATRYGLSPAVEASDNLHWEFREGKVAWEEVKRLWLFDLDNDPSERHDLSGEMPAKVLELEAILASFEAESVPPHENPTREDIKRAKSRFVKDGRPVVDVWTPAPGGVAEVEVRTTEPISPQTSRL
jgi:arylsulfatase A-like enzyme